MKALTIKQPWLWAITDSTRRVENRTWKPPLHMVGQRIALHSSARVEQGEMVACRRICLDPLPHTTDLVTGAIIATAVIAGYVIVDDEKRISHQFYYTSNYEPRTDPWFFGPVGWLLTSVQKLAEPIPCKGALRLWEVPASIVAMMGVKA